VKTEDCTYYTHTSFIRLPHSASPILSHPIASHLIPSQYLKGQVDRHRLSVRLVLREQLPPKGRFPTNIESHGDVSWLHLPPDNTKYMQVWNHEGTTTVAASGSR